ncbi:hypothetical protein AAFF_G00306930 [Aldrovandia affinis]|uniref:Uncharacterized protein n=1 Tax=Aldrovandia affinis TaxID=143900 RepID=A0AAD7W060_9TELE|nr:hypothetical protein AAFF_G00306930 [Aldrovandia affinis]
MEPCRGAVSENATLAPPSNPEGAGPFEYRSSPGHIALALELSQHANRNVKVEKSLMDNHNHSPTEPSCQHPKY